MSYDQRTLGARALPPTLPKGVLALTGVGVTLTALAFVFLPFMLAAWLVGGLFVAVVVLWRPVVGLYVLPFAVAFGSLVALTVAGIHVGPTDVMVALLVVAGIVSFTRQWRARAQAPTVDGLAQAPILLWRAPQALALLAGSVGYLFVVVLSLAVAANRAATVKEVIKWAEVAALIPLAYWFLRDVRQALILAWAIIGSATLEALVGIGQWAIAGGDPTQDRVLGTLGQPNPFTAYLNLALPLAVALALLGRDWRMRWVAGGAATVLVGAELVSRSRGGLVGLVIALCLIGAIVIRRERLAAIVVGAGAALVAVAWALKLVPASVRAAVSANFTLDNVGLCDNINPVNFSTLERLAQWAAGLRMFLAHPFLGVGAGNFDTAYPLYAVPCWPDGRGHAHNYYINTAAETGVVGFLVFLAFMLAVIYVGWRATHLRSATGDASRATIRQTLALGLFACVVTVLAHNFTDDLFVHSMELQFAICLGLLLRLSVLAPPKSQARVLS